MRKLILFVATGAGSGYSPVAPGTAGSAVGLLIWVAARGLPGAGYLALVAAVTGMGIWASARAEEIFERKDDGRITIDEVAGMLLSLALMPGSVPPLHVALVGFLLFRIFDIIKPPPARAFEALSGGRGVMLDDIAAGVYANLAGQILWRLLLPGGIT